MSLRRKTLILALSVGLPACDPYKNLDGDYYFISVDPGCPADKPSGPGFCNPFPDDTQGTIVPNAATVLGGESVAYFSIRVAEGYDPTQFQRWGTPLADPLLLRTERLDTTPISDRNQVYVFDTAPGMWDGSDTRNCQPVPPNALDGLWNGFAANQQLNIFQQRQVRANAPPLPSDQPFYQAIFAEVPVQSQGNFICNSIASADGLMDSNGRTVNVATTPAPAGSPFFRPVGQPDGFYRALGIIEAGADVLTVPDPTGEKCPATALEDINGVCRDPVTHLGPQKFAFIDHYSVAYLDGGYVPTTTKTIPGKMGAPDKVGVFAQQNIIYAPDTYIDGKGKMQSCGPAADRMSIGLDCLGHGFEFIDGINGRIAKRDAENNGYSPICSVQVFTPTDPSKPITDPTQINRMTVINEGAFVYCLQVK